MAIPDNIQSVTIPANKMPYSTSDGFYYVRYRVITESKDIFSTWSPKFKLPVVPISSIVGESYSPNLKIVTDTSNVKLTWDLPTTINLENFDVYVKWSTQGAEPTLTQWGNIDWKYATAVQGNSVSVKIPAQTKESVITGVTYDSTTATYETTQSHNLQPGDNVTITGLSPHGYNGVFQVSTVNAPAKKFTVLNDTNETVTDSGGFVSINTRYFRMWVQVPTQSKFPGTAAKLFETDTIFINQTDSIDGGSPEQLVIDGNLL